MLRKALQSAGLNTYLGWQYTLGRWRYKRLLTRISVTTTTPLIWEASVCSSTDRASDYGSEGWGFESLQAHRMAGSSAYNLSSILRVPGGTKKCVKVLRFIMIVAAGWVVGNLTNIYIFACIQKVHSNKVNISCKSLTYFNHFA